MQFDAAKFTEYSRKLNTYADGLGRCARSMQMSTSSNVIFRTRINIISKSVLEKAAQMSTLNEAIQSICETYTSSERKICGSDFAKIRSQTNAEQSESGTDKRSLLQKWWDSLLEWLGFDKKPSELIKTTREQESAYDRQMQNQIEHLTDFRYSEERWVNATTEERMDMLRNYMNEVAAIMGVTISGGLTMSYEPRDSDGNLTLGYYSHDTREIWLNTNYLVHRSAEASYEMLITVVHELRHAYQHAAVDNPTRFMVSQETIDAWEESFDTYAQEEAAGRYWDIVVERDARAFSERSDERRDDVFIPPPQSLR